MFPFPASFHTAHTKCILMLSFHDTSNTLFTGNWVMGPTKMSLHNHNVSDWKAVRDFLVLGSYCWNWVKWIQKSGIYPLNLFRCPDFANRVEMEAANSEQIAPEPTLSKKKYSWLLLNRKSLLIYNSVKPVLCLWHQATNRKVRVQFPKRSLNFSIYLILSSHIMALGLTQLLTGVSTRNLPGVKGCPACRGSQPHLHQWNECL
jgi:hypothetical protein